MRVGFCCCCFFFKLMLKCNVELSKSNLHVWGNPTRCFHLEKSSWIHTGTGASSAFFPPLWSADISQSQACHDKLQFVQIALQQLNFCQSSSRLPPPCVQDQAHTVVFVPEQRFCGPVSFLPGVFIEEWRDRSMLQQCQHYVNFSWVGQQSSTFLSFSRELWGEAVFGACINSLMKTRQADSNIW